MKKIIKTIGTAAVALCLGLSAGAASGAWQGGGFGSRAGQAAGPSALLSQIPASDLSDQERDSLAKMREEEKLARDVYVYLYTIWQNPVFDRISRSEQRHMDAVKALLDRYGIEDPAAGLEPGVFKSAEMQELYNDLTAKGSESLEAALRVGATIEDLDIKDLEELLPLTDNEDIQTVYQNLMKGSRNHLRAFTSQLKGMGQDYQAQFLTQEELEKIVNSPWERGRVDKDGNPVSGGMGQGMRGRGFGRAGQGTGFVDSNGDGICDNLTR